MIRPMTFASVTVPPPLRALWLVPLIIVAIAQVLITFRVGASWAPPALWAVAAAMIAWSWRPRPVAVVVSALPAVPPRVSVVVAALLLLPVAWIGAADNTFRWWGVAAWLGSLALWLWGWRALARPLAV